MSEGKLYPVPAEMAAHAWINNDQYLEMYQRSVDDPEGFWAEQANQFITWFKPWNRSWTGISPRSYPLVRGRPAQRQPQLPGPPSGDARRSGRHHLGRRQPQEDKKITYKELHEDMCKFANVLKSLGVKKGIASAFTCR
ncbi:MAG: acetyl-coenzyme A synthetase N-terminal domain-containing protein [Candidatus Competibacteraceae bacterium]